VLWFAVTRRYAAVIALLALIVAGCGGSTTTTTEGSISGDDVVFGSGTLPDTLEGFPLPTGSAIGSTMVVTTTGFTEAVVRISATMGITAAWFEQNLPGAGFTVDSSQAEGKGWAIEYRADGAKGTIDLTEPQEGITQAIVRLNVP
jgi:hypothetical protein